MAEGGDAGETLATAQAVNGSVTRITGTLENRGSLDRPVEDIDLYRIFISNPAAFGVTVETNLEVIGHPELQYGDDTMLFLFDTNGAQVGFNDDVLGLPGVYPQFDVGTFAALGPGFYYLGFDIFPTHSVLTNGILSGFVRADTTNPLMAGAYALNITGAQGGGGAAIDLPPGGVPEPATWALMIVGFGGAGAMMRRRRAALV